MSCFICKRQSSGHRTIDGSRLRYMRKAVPKFKDSSLLCEICFKKFETIFLEKKRQKIQSSSISVRSNATTKTVSTKSDNAELSTRILSSEENLNSDPQMRFEGPTLSDESLDSTDRLVLNTVDLRSLKDSAMITRNPEINLAREGAHLAEQGAIRRRGTRESGDPKTPTGRNGRNFQVVSEDDEDSISTGRVSDISFVQPIVKKRKQPVVHLNRDIMAIYLANTSGG